MFANLMTICYCTLIGRNNRRKWTVACWGQSSPYFMLTAAWFSTRDSHIAAEKVSASISPGLQTS